MSGERLRKINESGKYPDVRYLKRRLQLYWILEVMDKDFKKDKLAASEISDFLFRGFKIHVKPITVVRSFSRAGDKIRTIKEKKAVYYQITSRGQEDLYGSQLPPPIETRKLFRIVKKLGKKFENDYKELSVCYKNSCGAATAFLMRKILEKTIFFVFAKHKMIDKLRNKQGHFFGLQGMLKIACKEKVGGVPCLMPKTCKKIQGIKFLGDVAAHDFLIDVDIEEVKEHLPYILVAIKELSTHL